MRKLTIALALVLCLVLCIFCFASCKKKGGDSTSAASESTPASDGSTGTTAAVPTQPAHVHVPEDEWRVTKPANCTEQGEETLYCADCGEIMETRKTDVDSNVHVVEEWETTAATVINPGVKTGTCTKCHQPVEEEVAFAPKICDIGAGGSADSKKNLLTTLNGEHFYPTEGKDDGQALFVQMDMLWNETITTKYPDNQGFRLQLANSDTDDAKNRDNLFLLVPKNNKWGSSDAKAPGGFDYGWTAVHNITDGPLGCGGPGGKMVASNFPNIGDYGWHRIGIKVYETAEANGTSDVDYRIVSTLYLDGVKAWEITYTGDFNKDDSGNPGKGLLSKGLMLFTATNTDGDLSYEDPTSGLYFHFNAWDISGTPGLYIVYGPVLTSIVDPDYAPDDIVPVVNPKPATLDVGDGVVIDSPVCFAKAGCAHEKEDEWVVSVKPSLLGGDGVKGQYCSKCGERMEVGVEEYQPIVYLSNWDLETRMENEYTIVNPDDSTIYTFGVRKHVENLIGDKHFYPTETDPEGNDLLIEFSFLYNPTMTNAGDGTLTAMYVENNNVFNVDLKNGKVTAKIRTMAKDGADDKYVFPTPEDIAADSSLKTVQIAEYGWHRLSVRIHQTAVIDNGEVKYTVLATAYLDGEKIFVIDKTDYSIVKHNSQFGYTGLLFTATINPEDENKLVYEDAVPNKKCDTYVMVEELPKDSANAGYLIVDDIFMTVGQDFVQDVKAVVDPADATYSPAEGVDLSAKIWFEEK